MKNGWHDAVFYQYQYLLLPEGYESFDQLQQAIRAAAPLTVQAVVLQEDYDITGGTYEKGCSIAPYFISDYIEGTTEITFTDPDEVYPTRVELLSQLTYNERLRKLVSDYCPGCSRFGALTPYDSSLSGHFGEISLDGKCFLRCEKRLSPNDFRENLNFFMGFWTRTEDAQKNAQFLLFLLKEHLHLTFDSAELTEQGDARVLSLTAKKSSILSTLLTAWVGDIIEGESEGKYRLVLANPAEFSPDAFSAHLTARRIGAFRKELKKYGVSLMQLCFDPTKDMQTRAAMGWLLGTDLFLPLMGEPGCVTLLMLSTPLALMALRYASPMLEALGATATVYTPEKTVRYTICFDMTEAVLNNAPVAPEKRPKISKRQLKAEEGKALKLDQVCDLFTYVETRLSDGGCDHTLRHTTVWLREHLSEEQAQAALAEIFQMGGYCDCEVLLNCYQDYRFE